MSAQVELPPPYILPPCITKAPPVFERRSHNPLEIKLDNVNCTFGTMVTGKVHICPGDDMHVSAVKISIVNRERAGFLGYDTPVCHSGSLAHVRVPVYANLKPGKVYTYTFMLQFPSYEDANNCKCQKGVHMSFPPNFDINQNHNTLICCQSVYYAKASISGTRIRAKVDLDFKTFVSGVNPEKLRPEPQYIKLPFQPHMKKTWKKGHLFIRSEVSRHSGSENAESQVEAKINYIPHRPDQSPPEIKNCNMRILQVIHWSRLPLAQQLNKGSIHRYESLVAFQKHTLKCQWDNNESNIVFKFRTGAPLTVSYVGCLTAVSYVIELELLPGVVARIPLTVGSNLPDYDGNIADFTPEPTLPFKA